MRSLSLKLAVLVVATGLLSWFSVGADVPQVPQNVRELMQDRKYGEAVQAIDTLLREDKPDSKSEVSKNADYLLFLKGRAELLGGDPRAAIDSFARVEREHAASRWIRRARFGQAAALLKLGDFEAAEQIYEQEMKYLLSTERKHEIASIYLEFADAYFQPPKRDGDGGKVVEKAPDYAKALNFYRQALSVGPNPERRIDIEFRVARCLQELNQLGEAATAYSEFVKAHGKEQKHADLVIEARFRLGIVQLATGQNAAARKTWKDLLDAHATQKSDRLAEAAYQISHTYGLPSPPSKEDLELGVAAAERFIASYPEHKLAAQAALEIAQGYSAQNRQAEAIVVLKKLLDEPRYTKAEILPDARVLLGYSLQRQKQFAEAISAWQDYLAKHPSHAAWAQVQQAIIDTEFLTAAELRRDKKFAEARKLWEAFLTKYPLDARAPAILLDFGLMKFEAALAAGSEPAEKSDEGDNQVQAPPAKSAVTLFEQAIGDWSALVSKYPGTEQSSRGQFLIGVTLEERLSRFDDALAAYRKLNWGQFAPRAQERIGRLTRQELAVQTERVFRSNQKPQIKVATRNIRQLTVKAYRVDMETYFRKMHLASGIEGLDIALIDPDKTFTYEIPDYADYKQVTNWIDVPLTGTGVMAVTVINEPIPLGQAGSLAHLTLRPQEATSMVLQSDLDILVKSSRNELFVFAENLRTSKPFAGAKLLVSDGNKVFAEGTTNADGVFVGSVVDNDKTWEPLKASQDIRVFAVGADDEGKNAAKNVATPDDSDKEKKDAAPISNSAHFASSVVGLAGVEFAKGVTPKGFVYTDRPAYRAGQLVHVRAVIRWVKGDEFVFESGKKFKLDVFDARGKQIRSEDVALGEFGTLATRFLLPSDTPQGEYRLHLHDPADPNQHNYQGTFVVHEFQLPPVQIVINTPRQVYYRGEEVSGTIQVKYYYDAPVVDREIRYALPDGTTQSARTNASGEVAFKFDTREFREDQVLPIGVLFPEYNVQAGLNLVLATRGFRAGISTARNVFLAGESFDVKLDTTDAAGKKSGQKMSLAVVRRTEVRGQVGESTVEETPVATDSKSGEGRATLKISKAGAYILRATGTDRFGNPVSAEHTITVSGDDDAVRLRILAERHQFKSGEAPEISVHWRNNPALALVTYQGARVLGYRLVELQKGTNKIVVPMTEKLAPNFELVVSVMTDGQGGQRAKRVIENDGVGDAQVDQAVVASNQGSELLPAFHETSSPFEVERPLIVSVKPSRDRAKPGEEIDLQVTATDPQGKPVRAEFSLAMIEKSLLQMFPDRLDDITQFFVGARRQSALRTVASCTFRYSPAVRDVSETLIAEVNRVAVTEMELRARVMAGADAASAAPRSASDEAYFAPLVPPPEPLSEEGINSAVPSAGLGMGRAAGGGGSGGFGGGADRDARRALSGIDAKQKSVAKADMSRAGGAMAGRGGKAVAERVGTVYPPDLAHRKLAELQSADGELLNGFKIPELQNNLGDLSESAKLNYYSMLGHKPDEIQDLFARNHWFESSSEAQKPSSVLFDDGTTLALAYRYKGKEVITPSFHRAMVALLPGFVARETGFWSPSVVTDEDGKATVKITMPERSTSWRVSARGISAGALSGEAGADITAKKDLFGELKLPLAFVDGDSARIIATIHNDSIAKGKIDVTLKSVIAGKTRQEKRIIDVSAKGTHELTFERAIAGIGDASFELTVAALDANRGAKDPPSKEGSTKSDEDCRDDGDKDSSDETASPASDAEAVSDTATASVPIRPFGLPVFATTGGTASSNMTAWISPPAGMSVRDPNLQIIIGPSVERSLLDVILGSDGGGYVSRHSVLMCESAVERTTSDLMASLALLRLIGERREQGSPETVALSDRVRSTIGFLVSTQNDDGGWHWAAARGVKQGSSDRTVSARGLWALGQARKAGFAVPDDAFNKAITFVQTTFTAARENDFDGKALMLHALATAGRGDFAYANRLHRSRASLSPTALAYLALSFVEMDRKELAGELLGLFAEKQPRTSPTPQAAELQALYLYAMGRVAPGDAKVKETSEWLLAHRTGSRWSPERATGPAVLALAEYFGQAKVAAEHYKLAVFVNDERVGELDIDGAATTRVIDVPRELLARGEKLTDKDYPQDGSARKQRINFELTGRGRFSYQAVLSGFVAGDQLKSTVNAWHIERNFDPAPIEMDGREIPRGFDVLTGSFTSWRNPVTQVPVGQRTQVQLYTYPINGHLIADEQREYLVVTEPIPAGMTVLEKSISGDFDRYEIGAGFVTFYLGNRSQPATIRFDLYGYLPGDYKTLPTLIRNFYDPSRMQVTQPRTLSVLASGQRSKDEYRLSPRELYELGKLLKDRPIEGVGRRPDAEPAAKPIKADARLAHLDAAEYLTELFDKYTLNADIYKEVAQMLFNISLRTGKGPAIVRYFEIIKEKYPELEVPFEQIVKVGAAYRELNEYERSYLVFRATTEASFIRESQVAGFLQSQGEFERSVAVMDRILSEYPAEPYIASATYALAQQVYAMAPNAAGDAKLREHRITKVDLIRQAILRMDDFLTAWPDDPAADQASFSLASALVELENWPAAIARSNRFAERYPKSPFLDSYWYIIGYSHFAQGKAQDALAMCRRVAEATRVDPSTGREVESPNKWRAIYISGQIHHSRGEAADAISEYSRVSDRFPDAKEAIDYFGRKAIELPEITTVKPPMADENDAAPSPAVELKFRNVAACELKVYRIDLMKFSLLQRDLANITKINLSGIRPLYDAKVELGDGKDYRDRTKRMELPLKEEGAYLIVCRGDDLHTSGLVLVTPLAVEVQEDATGGRIRATVKNTVTGNYTANIHVKAIGSRNDRFKDGQTDLRGIFATDGIAGRSTVIARAGERQFAFYRGNVELGPLPAQTAAPAPAQAPADKKPAAPQRQEQLLEQLFESNRAIQLENTTKLKGLYDNKQQGVEAKQAF